MDELEDLIAHYMAERGISRERAEILARSNIALRQQRQPRPASTPASAIGAAYYMQRDGVSPGRAEILAQSNQRLHQPAHDELVSYYMKRDGVSRDRATTLADSYLQLRQPAPADPRAVAARRAQLQAAQQLHSTLVSRGVEPQAAAQATSLLLGLGKDWPNTGE